MKLRNCTMALVCALVLGSSTVRADSLDEIIKSPAMRRVTNQTSELKNESRRLVLEKRGRYRVSSNHDKLFATGSERISHLLVWSCSSLAAYQNFRDRTVVDKEFVDSRRHYHLGTNRSVLVRFLVPHPKFLPMAELSLIKDFNALFPPKLHYEYEEEVQIRGKKLTLYRMKNGSCSIPFHLTKQSILNVSTEDCRDLKHMMTIAEMLNLDRVHKKLNS